MQAPVMEGNTSSGTESKKSGGLHSGSQGSLLSYTVLALGLALFIRFFVAAPYVVSGQSMDPNFEDWNYLIVDRITYDIGQPQRGDVVVFDLPQEGGRSLIKRIIGLPGETVVLEGQSVTIVNEGHPQGFTLEEPYLDPKNLEGRNDMRITLGADEYFVLGDNRRVSADSRIWGTLAREHIVGRAFVRLYPLNQIGFLPGKARYDE